jgi:hypothetical protein
MLLASALFGDNLLPLLVLALGAAMVVGYGLALVRPPRPPHPPDPPQPPASKAGRPSGPQPGDLPRAPVGRSLVMMAIGLIAGAWALASIVR